MLDGGPGAEPASAIDAWLVSDPRSELEAAIRRIAAAQGLEPTVAAFQRTDFKVEPLEVRHTSHVTYGYRISSDGRVVVYFDRRDADHVRRRLTRRLEALGYVVTVAPTAA